MKKTFVKVCINYFDEQEKPWIYLNIFQKKKKIPKPLEPFYAIQNLELSSLANHGDRHFFKTLPPPPPPRSKFTAATALIHQLKISVY